MYAFLISFVSDNKMKMKKALLSTINFCLLSVGFVFGCECSKVSHKFMDRIDKYQFVAMVEVIRKDTVRGQQIGNPKSFAQSQDYAFTVVKVIKQYSGTYLGGEIRIIDSKGFECFCKLYYKNIGDKFIVKGVLVDINEHLHSDWDKPIPKEDILVLGLCDTNQLHVDKNEVNGWITVNRSHQWWKRNMLLKKLSFGLINREKKGIKKISRQQMKIGKFEKILQRKIGNKH